MGSSGGKTAAHKLACGFKKEKKLPISNSFCRHLTITRFNQACNHCNICLHLLYNTMEFDTILMFLLVQILFCKFIWVHIQNPPKKKVKIHFQRWVKEGGRVSCLAAGRNGGQIFLSWNKHMQKKLWSPITNLLEKSKNWGRSSRFIGGVLLILPISLIFNLTLWICPLVAQWWALSKFDYITTVMNMSVIKFF